MSKLLNKSSIFSIVVEYNTALPLLKASISNQTNSTDSTTDVNILRSQEKHSTAVKKRNPLITYRTFPQVEQITTNPKKGPVFEHSAYFPVSEFQKLMHKMLV